MINTIKFKKRFNTSVFMVSIFMLSIFMTSCEFDLPEAGSKPDDTPPAAFFAGTASTTEGYLTYNFANLSVSATDFTWDFGDGNTSTDFEPSHTYAESPTDEDGTPYLVTLTATDKLNVTSVFSKNIEVVKPPIPPSIVPEILNGDFDGGTANWKISSFTGGNTNPFNASSDGSPLNYDGSDSGASKTKGAKWTSSTSAGPSLSNNSRFAYQALTVTPNTEYILEFQYAIKTDKEDIEGGDRIVGEILGDWFSDGSDALASSNAGPLTQVIGAVANGKGNFETAKVQFMTNDTGKISIWIYAITKDELYADNVKVYPVE